jgi:hypothetical protein
MQNYISDPRVVAGMEEFVITAFKKPQIKSDNTPLLRRLSRTHALVQICETGSPGSNIHFSRIGESDDHHTRDPIKQPGAAQVLDHRLQPELTELRRLTAEGDRLAGTLGSARTRRRPTLRVGGVTGSGGS